MSEKEIQKLSLATQIKKVIGNRILISSILLILIVLCLTVYDVFNSVEALKSRIGNNIKPLEDFVISQTLIANSKAINIKLDDFNHYTHTGYKIVLVKSADLQPNDIRWKPLASWIYYYKLGSIEGYRFGYFKVSGSFLADKKLINDTIIRFILLVSFYFVIFIFIFPLGRKIPEKLFLKPINRFLSMLENPDEKGNRRLTHVLPTELKHLEEKIFILLENMRKHERNIGMEKIGELATQLAHDIRSPLAVLNIETNNLVSIPEKSRINIRDAIQRVNDIANNILIKYKQEKTKSPTKSLSEPVAIMLESIVSEKRIQVSNSNITIEIENSLECYAVFIKVDMVEFKRVLSNIINNAIEAVNDDGSIAISLNKRDNKISICIKDNGHGIPKDKISFVLEEGVTLGEKKGSGLGLSYAVDRISSWQGEYSISSVQGEGTQFEIILPEAEPAKWFAQEITIADNGEVVILDDDAYVHQIWNERFSSDFINQHHLKLLHFYAPQELINFCEGRYLQKTTFLLDYELVGYEETGLMLMEMLNIASQSILVTSRYEDIEIREKCQALGIKIIPKPFTKIISINNYSKAQIVFIDDDEMMVEVWQEAAKVVNKDINVFKDPRDFINDLHLYNKNTYIYIDSSLGNNLRGEDFAKTLYEKGYQNIFIATGYPKDNFKDMYWIKGIVGKEPPF